MQQEHSALRDFLHSTSLEELIRLTVLIIVSLNMYFIKKNYALLKANRRNIHQLMSCIKKARLHKAFEMHNTEEVADVMSTPEDVEDGHLP